MAGLGDSGGTSGAIRAGRAFVEIFMNDNAFWRSWRTLQSRMKQVGRLMVSVGVTTAGVGALALKPVVETFTEFDDAIRAAGARTEATADQFDRLRAKALELGRTTSFTATEVARTMNELGTGGFNADQVKVMTAAVLDLARAAGTDAATSGKILAAAMNAFGLQAGDAAAVADKFTVAANKSAVSVESLGETFQYLAPVARDLGITLDASLALAGALGNVGIQGSEAGTALRRMGVLVASGSKDLERIFGVAGQDAAGNVRPLVAVMDEIQQSMAGLGGAAKTAKLNEFFGLLGITGASAIGKTSATVRDLESAIAGADGTAARTARGMDAGLGGTLRRLRGSVEGLVIGFGDALVPALTTVSDVVRLIGHGVRQWIADNQSAAATIAGVTVGVIAAGAALAGLGVALTLAGTALGAVTAAGSAVLTVLGTLLSPAIGVIALGTAFATQTEKGRAFFAAIGERLGPLRAGFRELNETFQQSWGGIVAAVEKGDLDLAVQIAGAGLKLEWQKVMKFWTEVWSRFKGGFLKDLHEIAVAIEDSGLWKAAKWLGDKGWEAAGAAKDTFVGSVIKPWEEAGKIKTAEDLDDTIRAGVGLFGAMLGMPADRAGGAPDFAAAALDMADAARAAVPADRVSTWGAALAPFLGADFANMIGLAASDGINAKFAADPDGSIARADAEIAAARAELDALVARARGAAEGGPAGNFGGGGDFGDGAADAAAARPVLDAAAVRGAFMVADARQMFGYSDTIPQQQLDALKAIRDGKGALAEKIGVAVLNGMRAK
ncbi:Family phage tail tape measure protein OS=Rhodopirellula baltica SH28 GN=RBSH_02343 PE=4 SV=1: PhageMin_Tail [Gemmataceae bacterium]|nr:Family phage tail tape measure protein OS=Rhodopirellula baltica SH28 GN=RBSH_02343 PE=4 SV=1: PhageMin_Tail [Gemmataceae bacterium]VTU00995.1 Family phage tail tape measure protein OS=Rhodopirellula baltica SH28 GN=RBSH_02343 PE=4 SV=1: PhageMin_Tail [Gemmataceae bacterium]